MEEAGGKRQGGQSRYPGLTVVHVAQGMLRAQVIRAKLEEAGIPVMLGYESVGQIMGITVDGLGEVHVLVPTRCADEAQALIEEQGEYESEDEVDGWQTSSPAPGEPSTADG